VTDDTHTLDRADRIGLYLAVGGALQRGERVRRDTEGLV